MSVDTCVYSTAEVRRQSLLWTASKWPSPGPTDTISSSSTPEKYVLVCIYYSYNLSNVHYLQVVIMDIEIKQTVGVINLERNASPFLYLMPCRQRDLLYCLHENGCVSVRVQQSLQLPTSIPMSPFDAKVHLLTLIEGGGDSVSGWAS